MFIICKKIIVRKCCIDPVCMGKQKTCSVISFLLEIIDLLVPLYALDTFSAHVILSHFNSYNIKYTWNHFYLGR